MPRQSSQLLGRKRRQHIRSLLPWPKVTAYPYPEAWISLRADVRLYAFQPIVPSTRTLHAHPQLAKRQGHIIYNYEAMRSR